MTISVQDTKRPFTGKTVTTEFAATPTGAVTHNPHDTSRTPGGSSSGSAAAVADFQIPISTGTQTLGSVSRPASFCGVAGYKATWGAISSEGVKVTSPTCDTLGFFARSVRDLFWIPDVFNIGDEERGLNFKELSKCKLGLCKGPHWSNATPAAQNALLKTAEILKSLGAQIEDLQLPTEYGDVTKYTFDVVSTEMNNCFRNELMLHGDNFDTRIKTMVKDGEQRSRREYLNAIDTAARLRSEFDEISAPYHAILALGAIDEAPEGMGLTGDPVVYAMWTVRVLLHVVVAFL